MGNEKPYWWPDARGWIAIAMFLLSVAILVIVALKPSIADNEFFKVLAGAIVITGLLNNVTGYYFTSSKTSGEMREQVTKALDVAKEAATNPDTPQKVEVTNTAKKPAIVAEVAPVPQPKAKADEGMPDYAR